MKLYYWPKTRAFRALWMLEELRVPYEFAYVNIRAGEQNAPAFCSVNPMSKLPALDDDGVCVAESGAVLLYLADKYPQAGLGVPTLTIRCEAVSFNGCFSRALVSNRQWLNG